jgi:hypothetical protein
VLRPLELLDSRPQRGRRADLGAGGGQCRDRRALALERRGEPRVARDAR